MTSYFSNIALAVTQDIVDQLTPYQHSVLTNVLGEPIDRAGNSYLYFIKHIRWDASDYLVVDLTKIMFLWDTKEYYLVGLEADTAIESGCYYNNPFDLRIVRSITFRGCDS